MEGLILCVHLLILQQAVTAQVTLSTVATFVEGSDGTFECTFTGTWDATFTRQWTGPGSVTLISQGVSINTAKYTESLDTGNNKFSMTVKNFTFGSDQGSYQCVYGFATSNQIILSLANTEAHPSTSPLDNLVIPGATEAIDLTINVPNVRPNATASFNLTSSSGALTSSGNNLVDSVTADAGGETFSSIFKINVGAGMTADGDILAIELVVGTYSVSKQWTITGTTTPTPTSMPTPTPRPCQCSWLPCGWKCYYMYIIIIALVLLVCLVVGLCCCYRRGYFGMGSKKENSREHSHVNKAYTSDIENGQPTRSSGGHREQTLL